MNYQLFSDNDILSGLKHGYEWAFKDYFYQFCLVGYRLFDKRYGLSSKQNLDFMSMAHQYALYLIEHDWKPLDACPTQVSLRSWLINGFRYVVLDALKWYKKEYGSIDYEDYLRTFDMSSDIRSQFNKAVQEMCDHTALSRDERLMVDMLMQGYKEKEVAARLGITPAAVSQKFKKLRDKVIVPYFRKNYDVELEAPVVMDMPTMECRHSIMPEEPMCERAVMACLDITTQETNTMEQKRTTPNFINSLQPGEIFVFGSNLKGLHGGGAAYAAYRKFGAIMGQGVGLQGQSYAIPTMQGGVETIRPYVDEFIAFARQHPELTFLVTRIGCGIAGFTDGQIAPLFEQAHQVDNIVLPAGW